MTNKATIKLDSSHSSYHNIISQVRLCKNCIHYKRHPVSNDYTYGFCEKVHSINLVDGEIHMENVEKVRVKYCKGLWFDDKNNGCNNNNNTNDMFLQFMIMSMLVTLSFSLNITNKS